MKRNGRPPRTEMRVGDRFGSWVVVDPTPPDGSRYPSGAPRQRALVRCGCGAERLIPRGSLRAGTTSSCSDCREVRYASARSRRVGRIENGFRVVAVPDRRSATYECVSCGDVVAKRYENGFSPQPPSRCLVCNPRVLTRAATEATGVSREAIRLRVLSGWTVEEAQTRRRGDVPARLLDARHRLGTREDRNPTDDITTERST